MLLLVFYISVLFFLYLCPLFLDSPCVCENIPGNRPKIIAHRGGAKLSPENTLAAMKKSFQYDHVIGMEADIFLR